VKHALHAVAAVAMLFVSACNPFGADPKDWYVKSVKGDTLTLYHEHRIFVVKCKGTEFNGSDKLYPGCPYLSQHVGGIREDGTGAEQVQRAGMGDIMYYTDSKGENGTHEIYEVMEETAQ
jgi:hypothetical protein